MPHPKGWLVGPMCLGWFLYLTASVSSQPEQASLVVIPEHPTVVDAVTARIDLTSDSLDPCDYAVHLLAAYGGLTGFEQVVSGGTITLRGELFPHLIAPVEVVPCEVPCDDVLQPPYETYAEVDLGRIRPGDYRLEVHLPELCGMGTPCDAAPILECAFELPLGATFSVQDTSSVGPHGRLAVVWGALKAGDSGPY